MASRISLLISLASALVACAGTHESSARDDFAAVPQPLPMTAGDATPGDPAEDPADTTPDGSLGHYLRLALAHSPSVRAAHARWEASVHHISRARRLPEPVLSFGVFLRAVETRVGPQRARIGIQQTFPWPGKLSAGSDASASQARALGSRLDALSLGVARRVEEAYWSLWVIRHTRTIHEEHLGVIHGLSETVRARIATGMASLADQQQIDLTAARIEDDIRSMDEAERAAEARLRAAVGLPTSEPVPTTDDPAAPTLPAADAATLDAHVREHPLITSYEWLAQAQESRADAEAADSLPSFTVGADWIITGEARMPGVEDSGKDAIIAGVGVRLPLWQGNYDDGAAAARAEAMSQRAEQRAAVDTALADLSSSLSATRDAARRSVLYADTLLPQADSAYASVLGAYTAGRGTVAQTLLAQRDLLELRVKLEQARADHMRGWARLRQVVGQDLAHAPYQDGEHTPASAPEAAPESSTQPAPQDHDHE